MRGFLFLEMQMQGKKRSKIGYLARLFNAADAFSGAESTHKSNGQNPLGWGALVHPLYVPFAGKLSDTFL
ncbi:hypothetical protein LVJ83_08435 [Uruburuella testudinis]|uniref:Uncharacterized protein n=1 Tax=Uruburuella testudinis TaxID=1282863 RepID=A0ABY4DPV9_9NEIS|nr:hypothetical protein [Uruburuella testudinis]UOO81008.1 hypothetical protein LVJ83_08435 [Uruburuella testudinis]